MRKVVKSYCVLPKLSLTHRFTPPGEHGGPGLVVGGADLDGVAVGIVQAARVLPRSEGGRRTRLGDRFPTVRHARLEGCLDGGDALRREGDLAEPRALGFVLGDEELGLDQPPADRVSRCSLPAPAERRENRVIEPAAPLEVCDFYGGVMKHQRVQVQRWRNETGPWAPLTLHGSLGATDLTREPEPGVSAAAPSGRSAARGRARARPRRRLWPDVRSRIRTPTCSGPTRRRTPRRTGGPGRRRRRPAPLRGSRCPE